MSKKKHVPFTESDLMGKGFVCVKDNIYVKSTNPIKEFVQKMEVPIKNERNGKYNVAQKSDRTFNGKVYDSKLEVEYAKHLLLLIKAGEVKYFIEQVPFQIELNGIKICKYLLDFKIHYSDGTTKHVDIKGMKHGPAYQMFKLKKKLVEAQFSITITEIYKGEF